MKMTISATKLIIITAVFLIFSANFRFFLNVLEIYPINLQNIIFLCSLGIAFSSINVFILGLFCLSRSTKPVLITILLISSFSAYFMDTYNIIIDEIMIDNIVKTDKNEFLDLISLKQFIYLFFIGILPSYLILKTKIKYQTASDAFFSRAALLGFSLLLPIIIIVSMSAHYFSFIREHKVLRSYTNPSYYIYSTGKYIQSQLGGSLQVFLKIGTDAYIPPSDLERELIILVIGETARADHFSLNGYQKKTNPLLEKEELVSFDNVWACGTSTSVSVPCLFSIHNQSTYEGENAFNVENALDVVKRSGVNVLWIDNNSDSKGVADRIEFINYKNNPNCEEECRDIGMLKEIPDYIEKHPTGDIFIILHQMGSHGPAYYKRYPNEFEVFTPSCQTNLLEKCSPEEIINAYDNTILYTDYFLSETIQLVKKYKTFESVLLYISDHGESLGENGIYLHGLPYLIAPDAQKHVPMVIWFNEKMRIDDIDYQTLKAKSHEKFSHDNLFHTILGLLEVKSSVYDGSKDIIDYLEDE